MEQTSFYVLGLTASTGVPWEYRIWGAGQKVGQGLFPWIGVGEVSDHVELNRYALLRLINATIDTTKGTKAELAALREMVMQNREVLDLLTASQGGVCKPIGQTCCTYIPDESGNGGSITIALQNLTALQMYVEEHTPAAVPSPGILSWLLGGGWQLWLTKIGVVLGGIVLATVVCCSCVVPIVRCSFTKNFQLEMAQRHAVANKYDDPLHRGPVDYVGLERIR